MAIMPASAMAVVTDAPTIVDLTSATHPDSATWYSDAYPTFSWSASAPANTSGYFRSFDQNAISDPDASASPIPEPAATYAAPADGTWYFHVSAADLNGFAGVTTTRQVLIDTTAPVTELSGSDDLWHNTDLPFTVVSNDPQYPDASGVTQFDADVYLNGEYLGGGLLHFTIENGHVDWTDVFPCTIADGIWQFGLHATDGAGNAEAAQFITAKIDTTAPQVELAGVTDGGVYATDQVAVLTATDILGARPVLDSRALHLTQSAARAVPALREAGLTSGVDSVDWRPFGATGWTSTDGATATIPISAAAEGSQVFEYRARDKIGNVGDPKRFVVLIDKTGPIVTATGADAAWHRGVVNVALSATDAQAHPQNSAKAPERLLGLAPSSDSVKDVEYREGAQAWTTVAGSTAAVRVTSNGVHTFQYRAHDNAGNVSQTGTFTVKIDTVKPVVTCITNTVASQRSVAKLQYRLADNLSKALNCRLVITQYGVTKAVYQLGSKPTGKTLVALMTVNLKPQYYYWRVVARDAAGNERWGIHHMLIVASRQLR
jgi:hypothetical protein